MKTIIVIKVGTNTLIKKGTSGEEILDTESFERIGLQIKTLQGMGYGIIVISSAAITAGMVQIGVRVRPSIDTEMIELQRLASIGWRHVLAAWGNALPESNVGELLLTQADLNDQSEREEALRVIKVLLNHGDVPIVNENDAITHQEISFGDNDTLAALLAAGLAESTLYSEDIKLILLSDVDGVYADKNDSSTIIPAIADIRDYVHVAGDATSANGTGGMKSKFSAAEIAVSHGVDMWITNGRSENSIQNTLSGRAGTHFTT